MHCKLSSSGKKIKGVGDLHLCYISKKKAVVRGGKMIQEELCPFSANLQAAR
jgi:hypothetical protein